jgi:hypothetical protein
MNNTSPNHNPNHNVSSARAKMLGLGALFLVLVATLASMLSSLLPGPQRFSMGMLLGDEAFAAGVVSQTGGLTCLTTDAGNEDLLLVLDGRNEELFVYRTDNKQGLQLLQRYPLPQMFVDARARSSGK